MELLIIMRNKILIILTIVMLLGLVSAVNPKFEKDNIKLIGSTTNYGKYTIEENKWWDVLKLWQPEKIKEIELKNNTDKCTNCLAEGEIVLYKDDVLIEDILFKRSYDNQNWIDWNGFINWKIYVENKNRYEEVEITELDCDNENKSCKEVKKKITLDNGEWIKLELGKVYPIGTYKWKLEGAKKPSTILDWVIKTNGELLTEWAVWGNISEGDDAEVVLNSPADGSTQYTNLVTTNATATITGGAYLVNTSLYDNSTGVWDDKTNSYFSSGSLPYDSWTADLKVDLKNYFKLDEITGTNVVDANKFGNGIASTSGIFTSQVDGVINTGADFSSGTASINLGDIAWIDSTNELTISTWVKWTDLSTRQSIAVKSDGNVPDDLVFVMELINSGYFKFETRDASDVSERIRISPTTWFTTGTYYHIVGVLNATHISLYINGNLANSTARSGSGNFNPNSNAFTIGRYGSYYGYYGLYDLDEFAIWERGISGAEVKRIYFSGINTSTTTSTNSYPVGSYIWNMQFCDSDGDCGFAEDNRTFIVDSGLPVINMSYPTTLINYGKLNGTLQLNFTATDTNLDKVWYNYNGVNTIIAGATSGVSILRNITLTTQKNVTIYANDTAGNLASETFSWNYKVFENSLQYNNPVLSTSSQTFKFVGIKHSTVTGLTARLFYNGIARTSIISTSGNNVNFTNSFEIPAGTSTRDFFWEITATTSGGTITFNTTTQTQTVQNISFTTCTTPTGLAYNFTTYDTETNLPLNSIFEATFSYYASGGSGQVLGEYNYQNLTENRSNYLFCLNSSGSNVTIDAFISYGATGYDSRDYIIDDGTIGNFIVTIPLYLTQTLLTDVVTFTVEDQNYDRLAGALVTVQKWNVGTNTYSTIGMFTTSSSGTGIMDLELYNTWYRAIVTYQGAIVHVSDIQKLGSTDWPITVNLGVQNPYDLFGTVSQGLEYNNNTQIVTYSWSDSSGYVNTVCMTIRKPTGSGYTDVYSDCIDSVAGSINYQFIENGTYEVYGTIYLTAEYDGISQVTDSMTITIGVPEITEISSPYGKVISFIIIGTGGLAGVSLGSPIIGIVLIIMGLFGASMMGWLKGVEAIMWSIVTIAIIIIARQSRRGS
jgi:hypothetical protein